MSIHLTSLLAFIQFNLFYFFIACLNCLPSLSLEKASSLMEHKRPGIFLFIEQFRAHVFENTRTLHTFGIQCSFVYQTFLQIDNSFILLHRKYFSSHPPPPYPLLMSGILISSPLPRRKTPSILMSLKCIFS